MAPAVFPPATHRGGRNGVLCPGAGSRCRLWLTRMVAEGAVSTRSCTKGTARGESAANLRRSDQRKRHRPFSTYRDLIHFIRRKWSDAVTRQPQPPARAHHLRNRCSVLYGLAGLAVGPHEGLRQERRRRSKGAPWAAKPCSCGSTLARKPAKTEQTRGGVLPCPHNQTIERKKL